MDCHSDLVQGILKIKGLASEFLEDLILKGEFLTSLEERGVGRVSQKMGHLVK